jgi:hypothetical protein
MSTRRQIVEQVECYTFVGGSDTATPINAATCTKQTHVSTQALEAEKRTKNGASAYRAVRVLHRRLLCVRAVVGIGVSHAHMTASLALQQRSTVIRYDDFEPGNCKVQHKVIVRIHKTNQAEMLYTDLPFSNFRWL